MMPSSVVTLMVRIPAYIAPGQKGRGKILKCTFSPHASVYQVRITIAEVIVLYFSKYFTLGAYLLVDLLCSKNAA